MTNNPPNSNSPSDSHDGMIVARGYAGQIGEIPSSFTSTIRSLIQDEEKNKGQLGNSSRFMVLRLLKGPSLLAPIYYAAKTFYPQKVSALSARGPAEFIKVFSSLELAGLVSLVYLFKKVRAVAKQPLWENIASEARSAAEIGGQIGIAIPRIGLTGGVVVGSLPIIALALFDLHDPKGFAEYRRKVRSQKLSIDLASEMERWGCTRYNIAAILLQTLGFGVPLANAFSLGLSSPSALGEDLQGEEYRFKITSVWINTMLDTGKPPAIRHRGEYYPQQQALEALLPQVAVVRQRGSMHDFLHRTKDDIGPDSSPELFIPQTTSQPVPSSEPEGDLEKLVEDE